LWTTGQLTGDDPDEVSGDVYAFDAASDRLVRVSAPAAGAAGGTYPCSETTPAEPCFADGGVGNGQDTLAALGVVSVPQGGVVSGRVVFFESRSGLVAEDDDGAYDVYQWRDGVLSLLSGWDSGDFDVLFNGNDRAGRNVFVSTQQKLTWQDSDDVLDVYSLRVGGGIAEPVAPVACDPLAGGCGAGGGVGPLGAPVALTAAAGGGGNAVKDVRARLALRGPSRGQRRRAARRGVVVMVVRVSRPGRVRVVARARVGKRVRRVGAASKRLSRPGAATVRLRLNRAARRRLGSGRRLRVRVRAKTSGAPARTTGFTLRRAGR
jgi:hypothetical protein